MAGFHAIPSAKGWAVRRSGAKRATVMCVSRADAWHETRRRARAHGVNAYLHDHAGRIVTRMTYEGLTDAHADR